MKKIIILLAIILASLAVVIKLNSNYDYLKENGCIVEMSNNEYTNCAEEALKKIKSEKHQHFIKFQDFLKDKPKNALGSDEKRKKEFIDWYESSESYNHSRCLANMYWTGSGSAYDQNIFTCEIEEAQRDIQLLGELYKQREFFIEL